MLLQIWTIEQLSIRIKSEVILLHTSNILSRRKDTLLLYHTFVKCTYLLKNKYTFNLGMYKCIKLCYNSNTFKTNRIHHD